MLIIFTLAFLVISTFFVYRTAKDNGYNAVLWSMASVGIFIGIQFLFGIIYAVIMIVTKTSELNFLTSITINLLSIAASIGGVMLILNRVNKIRDDEQLPPPPPNFE